MKLLEGDRPRLILLIQLGALAGFVLTGLLIEPFEEIGMPHPPVPGEGPYEPTFSPDEQRLLKPLAAFAGFAILSVLSWRARERHPNAALVGLVAAGSVGAWFAFYEREHLEAAVGLAATAAGGWWLAARARTRPLRWAAFALQLIAAGMAIHVGDVVVASAVLRWLFFAVALGSLLAHAVVLRAPQGTRTAAGLVLAAWGALLLALILPARAQEPEPATLLLALGLLALGAAFVVAQRGRQDHGTE